jgi:hypothetical protein
MWTPKKRQLGKVCCEIKLMFLKIVQRAPTQTPSPCNYKESLYSDTDPQVYGNAQISAAPVPPDTYIGGDAKNSRGINRPSTVPRSEERRGERAQVVGERIETFESLHPPFKAYLSNIPYDLDEESVARFFSGLQVYILFMPIFCFCFSFLQLNAVHCLSYKGVQYL